MFNETFNKRVGKKIFKARTQKKMSRKDLGQKMNLHETTIKKYEDGKIKSFGTDKLEEFARALDVSVPYLMEWDDLAARRADLMQRTRDSIDAEERHRIDGEIATVDVLIRNAHDASRVGEDASPYNIKNKMISIPVLGRIPAGVPIEAIENIIDYEEIPEALARHGEYFGLQVKGNSMEPRVLEGDIVIVRKQSCVESGEIGIIMVNGEDATMKKVIMHENGLTLISFNPSYSPQFFTSSEVEKMPVEIVGKVIELRGKL
jgi:repressor LexA